MIPPATLLAFVLTAFVFVAIPGPSVLFVIGRALALGRIGALLTVLGNALGFVVQIAAIALGLGALIERSLVLFTVIKVCGALFLVYLGVQAIRHRRRAIPSDSGAPIGRLRCLIEGVVVGATNPKSIVFFLAILPQFVTPTSGSVAAQLFILGLVFAVLAVLGDSVWALAASSARTWFARSPRRVEALGAGGGVAMIGLGGVMALSGSKG